jgi:hypothetical protein
MFWRQELAPSIGLNTVCLPEYEERFQSPKHSFSINIRRIDNVQDVCHINNNV